MVPSPAMTFEGVHPRRYAKSVPIWQNAAGRELYLRARSRRHSTGFCPAKRAGASLRGICAGTHQPDAMTASSLKTSNTCGAHMVLIPQGAQLLDAHGITSEAAADKRGAGG